MMSALLMVTTLLRLANFADNRSLLTCWSVVA